ncbi:MAG TPA: serine/threonine-protein kinase [Nakamurella sp.]
MLLRPGDVFAGYTVERELGAGGMGSVYLVRHPRLPRHDALKLLNAELSTDPTFVKRFEREAELAAQLDHPNIVPVHDCGVFDGQLWISMRYVDGTNAEHALRETPGGMPPERAVRIVAKIASALDYAHRHLLLHRDVKPANILLCAADDEEQEQERVFLSDFGVAKPIGGGPAVTATGDVLGTLDYSAPEQIRGLALDTRSDIYALGCVLYKLLTGSVPYPGDTPAARVYGHLDGAPPRPSTRVPSLPAALDTVVVTAMAKKPDDRYPTGRAMAMASRAALTGGVDPAGEAGGVTTRIGTHRAGPATPDVTESLPGLSGAWSLSALGGPWRFARGRATPTGAPGRTPVDVQETVQIRERHPGR